MYYFKSEVGAFSNAVDLAVAPAGHENKYSFKKCAFVLFSAVCFLVFSLRLTKLDLDVIQLALQQKNTPS